VSQRTLRAAKSTAATDRPALASGIGRKNMSRIFRDWLRVRRGTVICVVIVCAIVSYSEQGNSQDDDIMKVVNEFQNPDPMRRSDAFYRLIETGLGARLNGRTVKIPFALSQLSLKLPDKSDRIKVALIELLERENSFRRNRTKENVQGGSTLGEEYGRYYGDLIAAVAGLKDIRALNGLLAVITTGKMATDGLAALGDNALDPIIERLGSEDAGMRQSAVIVLARMLDSENVQWISSSGSRAKIKHAFAVTIRDENPYVRIAAIKGIAKLNDSDSIALIENLAQNDPYEASQHGGDKGFFPVREVAKRALQSMKSTQPSK